MREPPKLPGYMLLLTAEGYGVFFPQWYFYFLGYRLLIRPLLDDTPGHEWILLATSYLNPYTTIYPPLLSECWQVRWALSLSIFKLFANKLFFLFSVWFWEPFQVLSFWFLICLPLWLFTLFTVSKWHLFPWAIFSSGLFFSNAELWLDAATSAFLGNFWFLLDNHPPRGIPLELVPALLPAIFLFWRVSASFRHWCHFNF